MIILVVENSPKQGALIHDLLQPRGRVELVANLNDATQAIAQTRYDLVLANDQLCDGPVHTWCQQTRQTQFEGGIIVLTHKSSAVSGSEYLHAGADDFLIHPINPQELVARIVAVTRRAKNHYQPSQLVAGPLKLDLMTQLVTYNHQEIALRKKEFLLLAYLMQHQYHILSRDKLFEHIWGWDSNSDPHTVEVHIQGLRQKIDQRFRQTFISTIYGLGYKFICPTA